MEPTFAAPDATFDAVFTAPDASRADDSAIPDPRPASPDPRPAAPAPDAAAAFAPPGTAPAAFGVGFALPSWLDCAAFAGFAPLPAPDDAGDDDEAGDELPDDAGRIMCEIPDAGLLPELLPPPELAGEDGADDIGEGFDGFCCVAASFAGSVSVRIAVC